MKNWLGLHRSDWGSDSNKRSKLTNLGNTERKFGQTVTESDLKAFESTRLPASTVAKSKWAMEAFVNWHNYRRNMLLEPDGESFDSDVLKMSNETLNNALRHFIVEIRKQDDEEYRGQTYCGNPISPSRTTKLPTSQTWYNSTPIGVHTLQKHRAGLNAASQRRN
ncbi:hypothetical protein LOTGIDRAFT_155104 [Lottia gigantea]|uniref:Uncharacterized protein n=1 Tax=Lottia gigantea TaxID=225164 RepID=V3ZXC7_LOTGI|nr:hypothetical protein LOTGIDRAFT_155104 [Lottia gigantea]ESO85616.1 hypothetical protein LOTGIDRAFT_155104 [Lottia gigantea]